MDRRQFLYAIITSLASLGFGKIPLSAQETTGRTSVLKDMLIIDAHAHPAGILRPEPMKLASRALAIEPMKKLGTVTSSFSAVGDAKKRDNFCDRTAASYGHLWAPGLYAHHPISPNLLIREIKSALSWHSKGQTLSKKSLKKIDNLYQYGVRIITLMYYRISQFGDIMTAPPKHKGLTREGKKLILKMQEMGIVVDVAHAHINTLKDIAEMTGKPLIDSHTGLSYSSVPTGGRRRTWKEMEMVVATGGVICTWLLTVKSKTIQGETFLDWAKEIKVMKERFGIEHIGLGTDTGGYLRGTRFIEGYKNLLDLTKLADTMLEVGLTKNDITTSMGGNLCRVLKECIG